MRVFRRVGGEIVDAAIDPKDLVFVYGPDDTVPLSMQSIQKEYDYKKHDYLVLDKDGARLVKDREVFGSPYSQKQSWPILSNKYKRKIVKDLEESQEDAPEGLLEKVRKTKVGGVLKGVSHEEYRFLSMHLDPPFPWPERKK